jgi:hypothetical protein
MANFVDQRGTYKNQNGAMANADTAKLADTLWASPFI